MDNLCIKAAFVLLLFSTVTANSIDVAREWRAWKQRYSKSYSSPWEETQRRHAWERSFSFVRQHGNRPGDHTYTVELNSRADMISSVDRLNVNLTMWQQRSMVNYISVRRLVNLPDFFDWRTRGVIAPVTDQGLMGSSLPIVATDCVQSSLAIRTGKLVALSEMETRDCCNDHLLGNIFQCIHDIGGLCYQTSYPNNTSPGRCKNSTCSAAVKVQEGVAIPTGREDRLQENLLQQPIMAAIDASHTSFQMYQRGIYNEPQCSSTVLDHVVLVVGYGTQNGVDYWIVENSWGFNWGIGGYILMIRNRNNQCGIATAASFPKLQ